MKRLWLVAAFSAAGLLFGCSQGSESSDVRPDPLRPGVDTLRAALAERDELERIYLLASYLRTLRPEDVPVVLAEFEKKRAGIESHEVRLLMLAWARFDGPGAFATARDWPTPWSTVLMEEAMYAWGFHDGWAALAEHEKTEDEELRESLRQALVSGWIKSLDRLGVSKYAATVPEGRRRARIALRVAGEAKRDGAEAVIAWADAVPEDAPNDFKATVFAHAVGAVTRVDPEQAVPWYEARMKHAYTAGSLRNIANKWAAFHDPAALIAWVAGLSLAEDREGERVVATRAAFRIWAEVDPAAVEAWIEAASAGPIRDGAIEEFARAIADASPGAALRWARRIEDDELRRRRTLRYSRKWFGQDAEAAQAWLDASDVAPELRQQILNNLPHAKRQDPAKKAESDG